MNFTEKWTCLLKLWRTSRWLSHSVTVLTRNVIMHPEELNVPYKLKEGQGQRLDCLAAVVNTALRDVELPHL